MSERQKGWTPRVIEGGKSNEPSTEAAIEKKPETVGEQMTGKSVSTLRSDMEYFLGNFDRLTDVSRRMDEITDFIFDRLQGFVKNNANIDLRRQGLVNTKTEELAEYILNSSESDWKTQPSFYGAVILEYQSRIDRIGAMAGLDVEEDENEDVRNKT